MVIKYSNIFRAYIGMVSAGMSVGVLCAEDETITLTEDTKYELPTNKNLWHLGNCTITSADAEDKKNLCVKGGEESGLLQKHGNGKFNAGGSAILEELGFVIIHDSSNKWADDGGDDDVAYGMGYGGLFRANGEQGDTVEFNNNEGVIIKDAVYDCGEWGLQGSLSYVYGGAIYTMSGGLVKFDGNGIISLENVGIASLHDSNYCYKDVYAYGGVVHAPKISISSTSSSVTVQGCYINQGVCTDVNGHAMGGAFYVHTMQMDHNSGNILFDCNFINIANEARGGAVYLIEGQSEICDNGLHVQFSNNYAKALADKNYGLIESNLDTDCYAYGGAIFLAAPGENGNTVSLEISRNVGNVIFENNTAMADYTNVTNQTHGDDHLDDPAIALGGAVYVGVDAQFTIENNGQEGNAQYGYVSFINNNAVVKGTDNITALGGAVYLAEQSSFKVQGNGGMVSFTNNSAVSGGGIYASADAKVTISNNVGGVKFTGNTARGNPATGEGSGGGIYASASAYTVVTLSNNAGGVEFTQNTAAENGGGVYAKVNVDIIENGPVSFVGNSAADRGGAIYDEGVLTINNNASVRFERNSADYGGAVYAGATLKLTDNPGSVSFVGNSAEYYGGAIYADKALGIYRSGNVSFEENGAAKGGAIYARNDVDIYYNDAVEFKNNGTVVGGDSGSAIYAESNVTVDINQNSSVSFLCDDSVNTESLVYLSTNAYLNLCENDAVTISAFAPGGVVCSESWAYVDISINDTVNISGCETVYHGVFALQGGALSIEGNSKGVALSNNSAIAGYGAVVSLEGGSARLSLAYNKGEVQIHDNYAGRSGGFVYAAHAESSVSIINNEDVSVIGNSARSGAGAIDMTGNLQIRNNSGTVVFSNNSVYDEETQTTVLKAICAGESSFSAANGGSVEFRDSVSINGNLELNADYKYYEQYYEQRGEIIFTGKYAEEYAAAHAGSDSKVDIDASRHSKVEGAITLANGTLKVADKAVLEGNSLSVESGKNARLVLSGGGSLVVDDALLIGKETVLQAGAEAEEAMIRAVSVSLDELVRETPVCGTLDSSELTLASGSTYALYGGILDLSEGLLRFEEGAAITLTGINTPVLVGEEAILLLFSGVSALEAKDVSLTFNGVTYGDENLVFDTHAGVVYLRDVAIIPEPSSAALSLTGITLLMLRRRRRA